MSVVPIRWRPLGTRDLEAGKALLTQTIASWQEAWFVEPFLSVEAVDLIAPAGALTLAETARTSLAWSCGPDAWLASAPGAFAGVVNRAMDLPKSFAPTDESRPALLADVEAQLVDELLDALRRALAPSTRGVDRLSAANVGGPLPNPHGAARWRLVTDGGETVLWIVCGAQVLWKCLPAPARGATGEPPTCAPRREAIAASTVSVAAMLGQCELSVPQLATLAVGDVITLDRAINAPIALVLEHTRRASRVPVATGNPGRHAGKLSIQLTSIARSETP